MAKTIKNTKRNEIRLSLREQLQDKNVTGEHFYDLVEDYMSLWDIKNSLIADIKLRGVNVEYNNGGGQQGYKRNDSLGELNKINASMVKILQFMKITTDEVSDDDDDYEL